ncbi:iron-containing alcohol dehydrogenase family protein [Anaerotalea alkaliphila]|uniref:Iron-containing alcohol dehydrogenase n=1 Tax=Anaerotalea alkaliphila TaxID=2662126 RepID=A0A7X5HU89_9FIRM|nr:iron-containing alcohol dehydrogenase family protein [Anaerotalea alkaliphila]NDL66521.1 iron-containing alcohol dehydrogenase [Anaerotalea alkaliphila]
MEQFYMPTKICFQDNVVEEMKQELAKLGSSALVVTGQQSAFLNGSYMDVKNALESAGVHHYIFSEVEENPSIQILERAMALFHTYPVDFVIGVGGGSAIDTAKALAVLLKNRQMKPEDLFLNPDLEALPVVAVPTTAGTGSETTPYAVFTDDSQRTKMNFKCRVFPKMALVDVRYFMDIPVHITNSTAVDSLSHIIEGYLVKKANSYSDAIAEQALNHWALASGDLLLRNYTKEMRTHLIHASTWAGVVISQTGTSLPHGLGYHLTYYHNISHGKATALFLGELLNHHQDRKKVDKILSSLGVASVQEFKNRIVQLVGQVEISYQEAADYAQNMYRNKGKLANHPYEVTEEELLDMILKSLIVY